MLIQKKMLTFLVRSFKFYDQNSCNKIDTKKIAAIGTHLVDFSILILYFYFLILFSMLILQLLYVPHSLVSMACKLQLGGAKKNIFQNGRKITKIIVAEGQLSNFKYFDPTTPVS